LKIRYFDVLKKVLSKSDSEKKVQHTQKTCVDEKIFEKVFFRFFKVLFTLKNEFRKHRNLEFKFDLEKIEKNPKKSLFISFFPFLSLFWELYYLKIKIFTIIK
jgi:hypothetical protein